MRHAVGAKSIQVAEVTDRVGIGEVAGLSSGVPCPAVRNGVGRSTRSVQFMIVVLNEKEGFVLAVVNVRYNDGPVHSEAIEILGTLVRRVRGSAGCVCVVIRYPGICIQPSTSRKFIHGAVECVGAGLYDCVKAAAR